MTEAITRFRGQWMALSNFHEVPGGISALGMSAATSEHLFNATKTLRDNERQLVLQAPTPADAKSLGRKVTLRDDWDEIRIAVMDAILQAKFASGTDEARVLLSSGDSDLVEGNSWGDSFWGVDDTTGEGQNWLGRLLKLQRSRLNLP